MKFFKRLQASHLGIDFKKKVGIFKNYCGRINMQTLCRRGKPFFINQQEPVTFSTLCKTGRER
ncbi:MAG: hypothetical protein CK425_12955 [Parachlamydia sp.]|nr:MAG: hypothetical protein CK425_12955 [Parachlamydia sp.]